MRLIRGYRLVLGVVVSITLETMGALTLGVDNASAQDLTIRGRNARANGGDGGDVPG
jgi:hypothetical protein